MVRSVQEIHDFYMSAPEQETGRGCVERTKNRNRKIGELFESVINKRRAQYAA